MAITSLDQLTAIYGRPHARSVAKVSPRLTSEYRAIVAASPFAVLATSGPGDLDCSPRGDAPGFVRVVDDRTLVMPDRRGNDRIDSLRNVIADPRVALLFLVPGLGVTLRVNGRAVIEDDAGLLASFAVEGKTPRTALRIEIDEVYFQCARAIARSGLWDPSRHADPASLPTPGDMLAALTDGREGGASYDRELPVRTAETLW